MKKTQTPFRVDSEEIINDSVVLTLVGWATPKVNIKKYDQSIRRLSGEIKQGLHQNVNKFGFDKRFLIDLDFRLSGIEYGKYSFFRLEVILFPTTSINCDKIKKLLFKIFTSNIDFNFVPNK